MQRMCCRGTWGRLQIHSVPLSQLRRAGSLRTRQAMPCQLGRAGSRTPRKRKARYPLGSCCWHRCSLRMRDTVSWRKVLGEPLQ